MFVLADLPFDPNVIIVFAMMLFAGIKALLEKTAQKKDTPPTDYYEEEEEDFDPYKEYEAELERQRAELELTLPKAPPALPSIQEQKPTPVVRPAVVAKAPTQAKPRTLTAQEKEALKNFEQNSRSQRSSSASTKNRLQKHLASPTAAREALLLAEVLGPPKALKSDQ